eukprot:ANDGO_03124.mRNA.1 hypothetical protein
MSSSVEAPPLVWQRSMSSASLDRSHREAEPALNQEMPALARTSSLLPASFSRHSHSLVRAFSNQSLRNRQYSVLTVSETHEIMGSDPQDRKEDEDGGSRSNHVEGFLDGLSMRAPGLGHGPESSSTEAADIDTEVCVFCLDTPTNALWTICGHSFCASCLADYLELSHHTPACPSCRSALLLFPIPENVWTALTAANPQREAWGTLHSLSLAPHALREVNRIMGCKLEFDVNYSATDRFRIRPWISDDIHIHIALVSYARTMLFFVPALSIDSQNVRRKLDLFTAMLAENFLSDIISGFDLKENTVVFYGMQHISHPSSTFEFSRLLRLTQRYLTAFCSRLELMFSTTNTYANNMGYYDSLSGEVVLPLAERVKRYHAYVIANGVANAYVMDAATLCQPSFSGSLRFRSHMILQCEYLSRHFSSKHDWFAPARSLASVSSFTRKHISKYLSPSTDTGSTVSTPSSVSSSAASSSSTFATSRNASFSASITPSKPTPSKESAQRRKSETISHARPSTRRYSESQVLPVKDQSQDRDSEAYRRRSMGVSRSAIVHDLQQILAEARTSALTMVKRACDSLAMEKLCDVRRSADRASSGLFLVRCEFSENADRISSHECFVSVLFDEATLQMHLLSVLSPTTPADHVHRCNLYSRLLSSNLYSVGSSSTFVFPRPDADDSCDVFVGHCASFDVLHCQPDHLLHLLPLFVKKTVEKRRLVERLMTSTYDSDLNSAEFQQSVFRIFEGSLTALQGVEKRSLEKVAVNIRTALSELHCTCSSKMSKRANSETVDIVDDDAVVPPGSATRRSSTFSTAPTSLSSTGTSTGIATRPKNSCCSLQ